ncbi:MAG: (Fe-S)-binding protein, partial [Desulfobacterales bacterium]
ATLLTRLGISFGILGEREVSDGNEANAMGESELFRLLAEENIKHFNQLNVKRIIALSPHGFNTLKNEYPSLGGAYQVFHYTQILADHVGSLSFKDGPSRVRVTYHDPCYLGRHNWEYRAARKVLAGLPGVEVREMDRSMQDALCCGGGGGNIFTDIIGNGPESPARNRSDEALETSAEILAVSCPTCAVMLADAVKANNMDDRIQIKEISEIVNTRLNGRLATIE